MRLIEFHSLCCTLLDEIDSVSQPVLSLLDEIDSVSQPVLSLLDEIDRVSQLIC